MELLAPAGTKESFIAAIQGGADSIYVGTKNFNARLNADNLNFYDLEVLVNHAKENNVKIYVTFNTLIKHGEINEAVKAIASVDRLNADAVIVQDLGISRIISEYFPNIKLHASTQIAVHNSLGMNVLAKMGFKRVVISRELSFSEIKNISRKSSIETEIFCHGALCFCISGMCLFSSLIGGYSGNRGLCTQPCRRIWKSSNFSNIKGYLFSTKDLQLAEYIGKLKKTGINSLKIEGRMRSSEYVYKTVKAYRMLIDAKESDYKEVLNEALTILDEDYARKKSICIFQGRDATLFEPKKAQCLGKEIGRITKIFDGGMEIVCEYELVAGDRIRVANPATDKTKVFKVTDFSKIERGYIINHAIEGYAIGNTVFIAGSHKWDEKNIKKEIDDIYDSYVKQDQGNGIDKQIFSNAYTNLIARLWTKDRHKKNVWIKIDNPEWIPILNNLNDINIDGIIFSINKNNINLFRNHVLNSDSNVDKLGVEFTPFIAQRDVEDYKQVISEFAQKGINKWILNNISQLQLVPSDAEKIAGPYFYVWNAYAARCLKEYGVDYFFTSWEDDVLNIARLCNAGLKQHLFVNVFGYPVITRSRMFPKEIFYDSIVSDKNDIVLKQKSEAGINVLIPENPVMLFNAVDKLQKYGVRNFVIDLTYVQPQKEFLNNLIQKYTERKNFDKSFKFNFKRGIK